MQVTMPQLGESVTEGTIQRWLKQPGQRVERYEPLVEVVTDKVSAEVPSPAAGVVRSLLRQEGETVPVGTPLCELEVAGERTVEVPQAEGEERPFVRASPYVRRLARERGVDLAAVPATGPGGRVTRADLEAFWKAEPAPPGREEALSPAPSDEVLEVSPMRRAIAQHMVRSKQTAPHATTWFEVDMSGVVALRASLKEDFERAEGVPLTYLPFVVLAAVAGLRRHPLLNSEWREEGIVLHRSIHVGVAVAVADGLVVPVVHHADRYSLAGLARELHDRITRARQGRLTLADVTGGTFTVNNPGSYGSVLSTPILNHPQAAILSMEAVVPRAVVVGDAIAIRPMMNLSLSFDHRVLDGAVACQFLQTVKETLESFRPGVRL